MLKLNKYPHISTKYENVERVCARYHIMAVLANTSRWIESSKHKYNIFSSMTVFSLLACWELTRRDTYTFNSRRSIETKNSDSNTVLLTLRCTVRHVAVFDTLMSTKINNAGDPYPPNMCCFLFLPSLLFCDVTSTSDHVIWEDARLCGLLLPWAETVRRDRNFCSQDFFISSKHIVLSLKQLCVYKHLK